MAKRKRTVGDVFLDLEQLFDELIDDHGFQWGDILYWVFGHLKIHRPDAREVLADDKDEQPDMQYGFKD